MNTVNLIISGIFLFVSGILTVPLYAIITRVEEIGKSRRVDEGEEHPLEAHATFGGIIWMIFVLVAMVDALCVLISIDSMLDALPIIIYVISGMVGWLISLKIVGVQIATQPLTATKTSPVEVKTTN